MIGRIVKITTLSYFLVTLNLPYELLGKFFIFVSTQQILKYWVTKSRECNSSTQILGSLVKVLKSRFSEISTKWGSGGVTEISVVSQNLKSFPIRRLTSINSIVRWSHHKFVKFFECFWKSFEVFWKFFCRFLKVFWRFWKSFCLSSGLSVCLCGIPF